MSAAVGGRVARLRERVLNATLVGAGVVALAALVHKVAPLPPAVVGLWRPALIGIVGLVAAEEVLRIGGWGAARGPAMRWSRIAVTPMICLFLIGRLASERWMTDHIIDLVVTPALLLGGLAALVDAWQAWRRRLLPTVGVAGAVAAGAAGLLLGGLLAADQSIPNALWRRLFLLSLPLVAVAGAAFFRVRRGQQPPDDYPST